MKSLFAKRAAVTNVTCKRMFVSLFMVCSLLQSISLQAKLSDYPKVTSNVPYSKIAELKPSLHLLQMSYGEVDDQKILFWPSVGKKQNNTVIFIHGGCWLAQFDITHSLALTSALAENGFDVYSIEYRRTGNGGEWPVALTDIQLALSVIYQRLADDNKVYNAPISIIGHSAGGHLATLAALNISANSFSNVHLFGLAPIIDLVAYAGGENNCQTATPNFMGGTPMQQEQAFTAANPLEYKILLEKTSTNKTALKSAIMMVGSKDVIVPPYMAQHPDAEFLLVDGAGHFDWIHPGSDAFKQLLDKLTAVAP